MPSHRTEVPKPDIALVLKELGCDDVPTGFGWVRMRCFAHEDRTPSAAVNHDPEVGGYHCHSCGLRGDGLKLLMQVLGLDWKEALRRAEALGGGTASSKSKPTKRRRASDLLGRG